MAPADGGDVAVARSSEVSAVNPLFSNFYISRASLTNETVRVNLVPFVHCQSYRLVWVNLDPP